MVLRHIAVIFVCGSLLACGTYATYRLPVDAREAPSTFSAIASAASSQGYQYAELPSAVNVRYDEHTWIHFTIQNDQYNMVVAVGEQVPKEEAPRHVSAAKQKGDELWDLAMAKRRDAALPR